MAEIKVINHNSIEFLITLVKTALKGKVDVLDGYGLVANDLITKLENVAAEATKNQTDEYLLNRANHTGTQSADTIVDGTANKVLTAEMYNKLEGLANTVIVNNLTSDAADQALSAAQGKALKALIDSINEVLAKFDADSDGVVDKAADADKLGGQAPAHYENVLTSIKVNGTEQTITDKAVDIAVPTDNSQLANGAGYQTAAQVETTVTGKGYQTAAEVEATVTGKGYQTGEQVETAITGKGYQTSEQVQTAITEKGYQNAAQVESAIAAKGYQTAAEVQSAIVNATHLTREIVAALPEVSAAKVDVIYMVPAAASTGESNVYDEYMIINGAWEKFGDTRVDLTGYVKEDDITELTDEEVQNIWDSVVV